MFLHWAVPPDALRALVPAPFSLDLHEGTAYAGIVAFDSSGLRPAGVPERFGVDFLETNVRTYVRLMDGAPGVYFFSLDASSRMAVPGGRRLFGLPYFHAWMRMTRSGNEVTYRMRRSSRRGAMLRVRYQIDGPAEATRPGGLPHFLIERYRFFVRRGPVTQAILVRHPPYSVHPARVLELDESLLAAAGVPAPAGEPLAHFSPGVEVDLLAPTFRRHERPHRG
ncbi:DUF2071 domain-containing protein [soil metagenome]